MKPLRVLFVIRSAEHFLRYDSIIGALCSAGHTLTVLFDKQWSREKDLEPVEEFRKKFPALQYGWLVNRRDSWTTILFVVRSLLTYRRYLTIETQSRFFRERSRRYMPFWLRIPVSIPGASRLIAAPWVDALLRRVESRAPADGAIVRDIRQYQPDVLVSPVGGIRVMSPNTEYLKAARALGIPVASPTISWDSLTTKTLITVLPDVLLLWNDFHKQRAIEHHRASAEQIRIIGAPVFDKWFSGLKSSVSRREFCSRYGLSSDKPYVLYLGSAAGTAKNEIWLITELRRELDSSPDPLLRELQVVVRPHPSNTEIYRGCFIGRCGARA
jgi:hypothetical protein